jgi:hypothetical protein
MVALAAAGAIGFSESARRARVIADEGPTIGESERLRLMIETDAGGDPDDEQSLVRFLLYANEWDVEGIIANRAVAVDGENLNRERTGLGIVRQAVEAYGQCQTTLAEHDRRYPTAQYLRQRTVAGYEDTEEGVPLVIAAVDGPDPRPLGSATGGQATRVRPPVA